MTNDNLRGPSTHIVINTDGKAYECIPAEPYEKVKMIPVIIADESNRNENVVPEPIIRSLDTHQAAIIDSMVKFMDEGLSTMPTYGVVGNGPTIVVGPFIGISKDEFRSCIIDKNNKARSLLVIREGDI